LRDFTCPPNLPSPKRFVQAGKFFGRRVRNESHLTGERKAQAKAFAYNKFQKESLNLGNS